MGRELKRVPLDFKWAKNQVWKGYINPFHSMECKSCGGYGLNPATKKISDDWYTHLRTDGKLGWSKDLTDVEVAALAEHGRLDEMIPGRPFLDEEDNKWKAWVNKELVEVLQPLYPTAKSVNEHFASRPFGHDSCNHWLCTKARAIHLGVYGKCEYCGGEGHIWQSDEIKNLHEDWKSFEPPVGEGYQLWETTSEGSPVSPVFDSLDKLCEWLEDGASTFGSSKATKEQWMKMLSADLFIVEDKSMPGVVFI